MTASGQRRQVWYRRRPSALTVAFTVLLVLYVLVTLGVIFRSPILRLDTDLVKLDLRHRHPQWHPWIRAYVIFGQRGPATLVFLPYFVWASWRRHSARPLVMLVTALVLLNLSIGVVKLATGRLGPRATHMVHDVFAGGDIYPSGHVSNTVVLYGLIAMVAVAHRRVAVVAAVFLSVTVGLGTIYLDTHWFSDVLGGWIAGGLVLLAMPWATPPAERLVARVWRRIVRWTRRRRVEAPRRPVRRGATTSVSGARHRVQVTSSGAGSPAVSSPAAGLSAAQGLASDAAAPVSSGPV